MIIGDCMNKINKLLLPLTILGTAVIFLILINHQKSYPSLKAAVRTTSGGGEVAEKMKVKEGYYVFIGDSSIITSGFVSIIHRVDVCFLTLPPARTISVARVF